MEINKRIEELETKFKEVLYALGGLRFDLDRLQPRPDFPWEKKELSNKIEEIQKICGRYKSQSSPEMRS